MKIQIDVFKILEANVLTTEVAPGEIHFKVNATTICHHPIL